MQLFWKLTYLQVFLKKSDHSFSWALLQDHSFNFLLYFYLLLSTSFLSKNFNEFIFKVLYFAIVGESLKFMMFRLLKNALLSQKNENKIDIFTHLP